MEQVTGIEPAWLAWKAKVLPLNYTCTYYKNGAQDQNRTGTSLSRLRILSPVRLPVPPPGHEYKNGDPQEIRTPDPLIKSQVLYRLS